MKQAGGYDKSEFLREYIRAGVLLFWVSSSLHYFLILLTIAVEWFVVYSLF